MDNPIVLKEYGQCDVTLSEAEVAAIGSGLKGVVSLWSTGQPGQYTIRADSTVGFAILPSGRTLVIEQKIPIETLFALLATVYDPDRQAFRDEPQAYTTVHTLFEYVVSIFATHVEDLIARGIIRGYRSLKEESPTIRGRLLFAETVRHRPALHDRHWCASTHFTPDVRENRIVRWTAHCLQYHHYREAALPGRLRRIGRALAEVGLEPEARRLFDQLEFHRLNDPYRPALALARLLLDHLSFSGTAGREPFLAYLVDMNWLFEAYVTALLVHAARQLDVQAHRQDSRFLDEGRQVSVRPDVYLSRKGSPLLVLDAKYKLAAAQADLYQVLAYCHALDTAQAVLIHPATEQAPAGIVQLLGPGNVRVRYLSLDLRGDPGQIETQGRVLVQQVAQILPAVNEVC